eukprot:1819605-Prymnesium_polylepis.1
MGHPPGRRALDSSASNYGPVALESVAEATHRCGQRRRTSRRATASRGPRCSWPVQGARHLPRTLHKSSKVKSHVASTTPTIIGLYSTAHTTVNGCPSHGRKFTLFDATYLLLKYSAKSHRTSVPSPRFSELHDRTFRTVPRI